MAASTRPQGREPGEPRDLTALRLVLERAIRSRCFGLLASARDDLVQNALVRILERNRHEELGRRGTSYVWKVAQSVIVDELRRLGRERRLAENVSKERRPWVDPAEGIQLRQCLERLERDMAGCYLPFGDGGQPEAPGALDDNLANNVKDCLLYTSPSPRD